MSYIMAICGFIRSGDIPSEATFSRAFAEFAAKGLGDRVHEALVQQCVKPELVGHISRDATAIRCPGKTCGEAAGGQAGSPEKRTSPSRGDERTQTRNAFGAPESAICRGGSGRTAGHCDVGRRRILKAIRKPGEIIN